MPSRILVGCSLAGRRCGEKSGAKICGEKNFFCNLSFIFENTSLLTHYKVLICLYYSYVPTHNLELNQYLYSFTALFLLLPRLYYSTHFPVIIIISFFDTSLAMSSNPADHTVCNAFTHNAPAVVGKVYSSL